MTKQQNEANSIQKNVFKNNWYYDLNVDVICKKIHN